MEKNTAVIILVLVFIFLLWCRGCTTDHVKRDAIAWVKCQGATITSVDNHYFTYGPFLPLKNSYIVSVNTETNGTFWFRYYFWNTSKVREYPKGVYTDIN